MRETRLASSSLIAGHVIECFDNTLYGFFAVMLAPIFFPLTSPSSQLLSSYGAFAAGFLARPLGALVFGWIGDKSGRRKPLLWSLALVGFPTIGIGLLPSYDSIGLLAPLMLVFFRLAQGFFYGAEFTGINLYISETLPKEDLGKKTGHLIAAGVFGAVLATFLGAIVTVESMPSFSWRIPFILGGLCAFFIFCLRQKLSETHDFLQKPKEEDRFQYSPWRVLST